MKSTFLIVSVLHLSVVMRIAQADEELQVLSSRTTNSITTGLVYQSLQKRAHNAFKDRKERFNQIKSEEDCLHYQQKMKSFFRKQIGDFPAKQALNPRVTGRLTGEGFRVENVIFESLPGHHITANIYLPDAEPPYPAVLVPCGHSHTGKAAVAYQRASILLAKNGMAALCYDPIGQGERYQVLSDKPTSHFRGYKHLSPPHPRVQLLCTAEHTLMSVSSILIGSNAARYRIWDGMRCIDYLESRSDIDSQRIGCTGNSGGGTLTSYLMALDDRIDCAAPVCYSTMFKYLVDFNGPQDGEQNIFGQLAFGMDISDYSLMRAPKPTLICAGTRDSTFKIEGTWELFREVKQFYSRMNHAERADIIEADAPHGFTKQLREAAARWMSRWLLKKDHPIIENEFSVFTEQELQCSTTGQILLDSGERSLFDINSDIELQLAKKRKKTWASSSLDSMRNHVREVTGIRRLKEIPRSKFTEVGTLKRKNHLIKKLILMPQHGIPLPALLYHPPEPDGEIVLYLHGGGKQHVAEEEVIKQRMEQGDVVLAIDVRCCGETSRHNNRRINWTHGLFGPNYHEYMLAYLLGESIVQYRAEDILVSARFLSEYQSKAKPSKIKMIAIGEIAIPALHAAALHPGLFSKVYLRQMVSSWREVVKTPETNNQLINTVHGALKFYDLPDLVKLVAPTTVQISEPAQVNANK